MCYNILNARGKDISNWYVLFMLKHICVQCMHKINFIAAAKWPHKSKHLIGDIKYLSMWTDWRAKGANFAQIRSQLSNQLELPISNNRGLILIGRQIQIQIQVFQNGDLLSTEDMLLIVEKFRFFTFCINLVFLKNCFVM